MTISAIAFALATGHLVSLWLLSNDSAENIKKVPLNFSCLLADCNMTPFGLLDSLDEPTYLTAVLTSAFENPFVFHLKYFFDSGTMEYLIWVVCV